MILRPAVELGRMPRRMRRVIDIRRKTGRTGRQVRPNLGYSAKGLRHDVTAGSTSPRRSPLVV